MTTSVRVCTQCGAAAPDGTRFCGQCGVPFGETTNAPASPQERRQVTVFFSDLSGFTALNERLDLVASSEGDTNCDDVTDGLDALADLQATATGSPMRCYPAGDYNCNWAPDAFDAIEILRRIAGLPVTMPVCAPSPGFLG